MWSTRLAAIAVCSAVLVALASLAPASAAPSRSTASCAGAIGWGSASRMIGQVATVKGRVAGTKFASSSNGSPTFLNLGVDYPSSRRFTVVIWGRDRSRFRSPESTYRGKTICVRGLIRPYQGIAEVFASSPSQIAFG